MIKDPERKYLFDMLELSPQIMIKETCQVKLPQITKNDCSLTQ